MVLELNEINNIILKYNKFTNIKIWSNMQNNTNIKKS